MTDKICLLIIQDILLHLQCFNIALHPTHCTFSLGRFDIVYSSIFVRFSLYFVRWFAKVGKREFEEREKPWKKRDTIKVFAAFKSACNVWDICNSVTKQTHLRYCDQTQTKDLYTNQSHHISDCFEWMFACCCSDKAFEFVSP